MKKILSMLLVLALLCPAVQAREEKYVALTFDDGPSGRFTRRLLEGLEARNVKATFALCGYRMKEYPDITQMIFDAGHEIGLHGYSHENMSKMSPEAVRKELRDTAALLPEGCRPAFLRPPGGNSSDAVIREARAAGLALLHWSVDPRDWENHDAGAVEAAVVDCVRDGDIILLHDMCDCSVDAAFAIIDRLRSQGFQFVTVSQLAQIKGVTVEPGCLYRRF